MDKEHSFSTEIAEKVGVNGAIIYKNIVFWCDKNEANDKHFHDGNYWTYNSTKAWKKLFPYMGESQIKTALKKLEECGLVVSGEYNENSYDRTRWFCPVEKAKIANGVGGNSRTIPDNKPYSKPYTKPLGKYEAFKKLVTRDFETNKILTLKDKINNCEKEFKLLPKGVNTGVISLNYTNYVKENRNSASRLNKYLLAFMEGNLEDLNYKDKRKATSSNEGWM